MPYRRTLWGGALFWMAFSVVAVALRGVRWEETYEHALVITRTVPYPEGHPFFIYCRNVFSGQSYLSALLMTIYDSPLLINGLRNVLQLAFCTVPVFLLGARFGGRAWAGHASVVLVLLGIHKGFQSYYPIESWPHFFATGQIGTGYALLVFALLLLRCWRSGWFLLGLMPMIHVGQWPVLGLFAGLQWLALLRQGDRVRVRQALLYFGVGMVPCIVFYFVYRHFHVPAPTEGAYFAEGDVQAIWSAYTERHDLHRAVPRDSFLKSILGGGLVLCLSGCALWRGSEAGEARRDRGMVFAFALLLSVVVGGIWLLHQELGGRAPFLLIGWMPYRLTNHLAILLVPLVVGTLWRGGRGGRALLALVLLHGLLLPFWGYVLPTALFTRYVGNVEGLAYFLCGGAIASLLTGRGILPTASAVPCMCIGVPYSTLQAVMPVAASLLLLAWFYPFAMFALLAGAVAWRAWAYVEVWAGGAQRWPDISVSLLSLLLLGSLLIQQAHSREQLPMQPIHRQVADWLDAQGEKDAMLVMPCWDVNWLAKLRRPTLADYQTAHLMSYMPALAPALKKMHEEVFGYVVDGETGPPLAQWPGRSPEAWRRLAKDYGFRYVLAPTEMDLKLERVLEGHPYDLYRVEP